MKKIEIKIKQFGPEKIVGKVSILQSKNQSCVDMKITKECMISKTNGATRLYPLPEQDVLPPLTDSEKDLIRQLISTYYDGINRKAAIYVWT